MDIEEMKQCIANRQEVFFYRLCGHRVISFIPRKILGDNNAYVKGAQTRSVVPCLERKSINECFHTENEAIEHGIELLGVIIKNHRTEIDLNNGVSNAG